MFSEPISTYHIKEYNLDINEFRSIRDENKKTRFTVTQDRNILMRFVVTDNVLFSIRIAQKLKPKISPEYLFSVLKYLKDSFGYKFDNDVFLQIGYFPIHFKFENYLIANYHNCDFLSVANTTFINLNKKLEEKTELHEIKKKGLNFIEPELNELKIYRHQLDFLIKNKHFDFIACLYEFYSRKINFNKHLSGVLRSAIVIDFEYLIILINLYPNLFKELSKEDARHLIKLIKITDDVNQMKRIMRYKMPDFNFFLLHWICKHGDSETIDLYIDNYSSISFYDEIKTNSFDVALGKLFKYQKLSNPEYEFFRLNQLKSLILAPK